MSYSLPHEKSYGFQQLRNQAQLFVGCHAVATCLVFPVMNFAFFLVVVSLTASKERNGVAAHVYVYGISRVAVESVLSDVVVDFK